MSSCFLSCCNDFKLDKTLFLSLFKIGDLSILLEFFCNQLLALFVFSVLAALLIIFFTCSTDLSSGILELLKKSKYILTYTYCFAKIFTITIKIFFLYNRWWRNFFRFLFWFWFCDFSRDRNFWFKSFIKICTCRRIRGFSNRSCCLYSITLNLLLLGHCSYF